MINIPFGGQYKSESLMASNQKLVNCYVNVPQTQSFSDRNLFGCFGIKEKATTGRIKQVNRGSHVKAGKFYFVNGEKAYRMNADLSIDELGDIEGTARCSFADNGKQLMIVIPGVDGFIINEDAAPVFQKITDPDFKANGNPQQVEFIDSFFVVTTDSKKFIKSDPNDGLSWNALDFASAESDPDDIVSLVVNNNKLYIGGGETIEEFQNLGLGGFPFQRTGLFIPKGVYAPFSMINIGSTFMWIGGSADEGAAIWMLSGGQAQKVSDTSIDTQIQKLLLSEISEAFSYSYSKNGQFFVGFTFPNLTIEYNLTSQTWHERRSQVVNTKGVTESVRWRANSIGTAYGMTLCGDSQDGRIGEIDVDTYKEYDRPIIRKWSTFTIFNDESSFSISKAELTMESGVGNAEQPDPEIRMRTSKDAKKYGNFITRKVGKTGEYSKRQRWTRLGRFSRLAVLDFEYSDPCKLNVLRLAIDIKGCIPNG